MTPTTPATAARETVLGLSEREREHAGTSHACPRTARRKFAAGTTHNNDDDTVQRQIGRVRARIRQDNAVLCKPRAVASPFILHNEPPPPPPPQQHQHGTWEIKGRERRRLRTKEDEARCVRKSMGQLALAGAVLVATKRCLPRPTQRPTTHGPKCLSVSRSTKSPHRESAKEHVTTGPGRASTTDQPRHTETRFASCETLCKMKRRV